MKVRMRVSISGSRSGAEWPQAGQVLECSDEEGMALCQGGLATPELDDPVETATPPAAETRPRTKKG